MEQRDTKSTDINDVKDDKTTKSVQTNVIYEFNFMSVELTILMVGNSIRIYYQMTYYFYDNNQPEQIWWWSICIKGLKKWEQSTNKTAIIGQYKIYIFNIKIKLFP